jgi:hypothetical protein
MIPRMIPAKESAFVSGKKGDMVEATFHDGRWQESVKNRFRCLGALREGLVKKRVAGADSPSIDPQSVAVIEFASKLTQSLEKGVGSIDCGVCILKPEAIVGSGYGIATVKTMLKDEATGKDIQVVDSFDSDNVAVLGLVNPQGLISPLAFSVCIMQIRAGKGAMLIPYGTTTDFFQLFDETLVAGSFS